MFHLTIREALLLIIVVAISVGWWLDHSQLSLPTSRENNLTSIRQPEAPPPGPKPYVYDHQVKKVAFDTDTRDVRKFPFPENIENTMQSDALKARREMGSILRNPILGVPTKG